MAAATAVVGAAAISAYSTNRAASKASSASRAASDAAAAATMESTRMQVEEIKRQFNYQQEILQPQIQEQYNAQRAYSDILGFGGNELGADPATGRSAAQVQADWQADQDQKVAAMQERIAAAEAAAAKEAARNAKLPRFTSSWGGKGEYRRTVREYDTPQADRLRQLQGELKTLQKAKFKAPGAQMGGPGSSNVQDFIGQDGFRDPNINQKSLADSSTYGQTVRDNLMAGTSAEDDPYRNYIMDNPLAAGSLDEDVVRADVASRMLSEGAAGTGVYGDVFQESPGYGFQVEEMNRQLERVGSAGGPNIGGRAIMEAQRRAQGLAAGEYYNWAAGRERDLGRLGAAEAQDASRLDTTAYRYGGLQERDVARGDQAYQDYMRRKEGDAARLDSSAMQFDQLQAADLQRQDQSYYNYLDAVARQAGFGGGSAAQAVNASGAAGARAASAYGQQGGQLASNYLQSGVNMANIAIGENAGYNNAIQSGIQNWMTYQAMQPANTAAYSPPPGPHS